jgi:hypothetical protein
VIGFDMDNRLASPDDRGRHVGYGLVNW